MNDTFDNTLENEKDNLLSGSEDTLISNCGSDEENRLLDNNSECRAIDQNQNENHNEEDFNTDRLSYNLCNCLVCGDSEHDQNNCPIWAPRLAQYPNSGHSLANEQEDIETENLRSTELFCDQCQAYGHACQVLDPEENGSTIYIGDFECDNA